MAPAAERGLGTHRSDEGGAWPRSGAPACIDVHEGGSLAGIVAMRTSSIPSLPLSCWSDLTSK
jgi:hypothetical protein